MTALTIDLPPQTLEQIADRAAELLAERQAEQTTDSGYLDVKAAADFLACPSSRIYALVSAKRIPFHRDGSRLLFVGAELRDYVAAGGARRP